MPLFCVTRPSDEPAGYDSQRKAPFYQYTRYRGLQRSRDGAIDTARKVRGRAYNISNGHNQLIYDAAADDTLNACLLAAAEDHQRHWTPEQLREDALI
jgi:hypothetical protein